MEEKLEVSKFKFSGSILKELSEKIPSVVIALNELIKNSYDAGANFVEIVIDSKLSNLVIKDDGEGIDRDEINTLFPIINSLKLFIFLSDRNCFFNPFFYIVCNIIIGI